MHLKQNMPEPFETSVKNFAYMNTYTYLYVNTVATYDCLYHVCECPMFCFLSYVSPSSGMMSANAGKSLAEAIEPFK